MKIGTYMIINYVYDYILEKGTHIQFEMGSKPGGHTVVYCPKSKTWKILMLEKNSYDFVSDNNKSIKLSLFFTLFWDIHWIK